MKETGVNMKEAQQRLHDIVRYTQVSSSDDLYKKFISTIEIFKSKEYTIIEIKILGMYLEVLIEL